MCWTPYLMLSKNTETCPVCINLLSVLSQNCYFHCCSACHRLAIDCFTSLLLQLWHVSRTVLPLISGRGIQFSRAECHTTFHLGPLTFRMLPPPMQKTIKMMMIRIIFGGGGGGGAVPPLGTPLLTRLATVCSYCAIKLSDILASYGVSLRALTVIYTMPCTRS